MALTPAPFTGVVLTGGGSTRMGRDKALIEVDGVAMAVRVAAALLAAGANPVVAIGGDADALTALGLEVVPDDFPGEGPLGGIATALRHAQSLPVLVAPCDLIDPQAAPLIQLCGAAGDEAVRIAAPPGPDGQDRPNYVLGWWPPTALPAVEEALAAGERAVRDALKRLAVTIVAIDETALHDADAPGDLPAGTAEER